MNRQLSRLDFLFATRIRNEPFGQFRTFTVGNHPAHHIAAEDVEDHVEIEVCPLRGTEQFRDIPAPKLVGASGQQFRLRVSRCTSWSRRSRASPALSRIRYMVRIQQ